MTTVIFIDKTSNYAVILETQRAPVPRIGERVLFDSKSGALYCEWRGHYKVTDVSYSVGSGPEGDSIANVYMEPIG